MYCQMRTRKTLTLKSVPTEKQKGVNSTDFIQQTIIVNILLCYCWCKCLNRRPRYYKHMYKFDEIWQWFEFRIDVL